MGNIDLNLFQVNPSSGDVGNNQSEQCKLVENNELKTLKFDNKYTRDFIDTYKLRGYSEDLLVSFVNSVCENISDKLDNFYKKNFFVQDRKDDIIEYFFGSIVENPDSDVSSILKVSNSYIKAFGSILYKNDNIFDYKDINNLVSYTGDDFDKLGALDIVYNPKLDNKKYIEWMFYVNFPDGLKNVGSDEFISDKLSKIYDEDIFEISGKSLNYRLDLASKITTFLANIASPLKETFTISGLEKEDLKVFNYINKLPLSEIVYMPKEINDAHDILQVLQYINGDIKELSADIKCHFPSGNIREYFLMKVGNTYNQDLSDFSKDNLSFVKFTTLEKLLHFFNSDRISYSYNKEVLLNDLKFNYSEEQLRKLQPVLKKYGISIDVDAMKKKINKEINYLLDIGNESLKKTKLNSDYFKDEKSLEEFSKLFFSDKNISFLRKKIGNGANFIDVIKQIIRQTTGTLKLLKDTKDLTKLSFSIFNAIENNIVNTEEDELIRKNSLNKIVNSFIDRKFKDLSDADKKLYEKALSLAIMDTCKDNGSKSVDEKFIINNLGKIQNKFRNILRDKKLNNYNNTMYLLNVAGSQDSNKIWLEGLANSFKNKEIILKEEDIKKLKHLNKLEDISNMSYSEYISYIDTIKAEKNLIKSVGPITTKVSKNKSVFKDDFEGVSDYEIFSKKQGGLNVIGVAMPDGNILEIKSLDIEEGNKLAIQKILESKVGLQISFQTWNGDLLNKLVTKDTDISKNSITSVDISEILDFFAIYFKKLYDKGFIGKRFFKEKGIKEENIFPNPEKFLSGVGEVLSGKVELGALKLKGDYYELNPYDSTVSDLLDNKFKWEELKRSFISKRDGNGFLQRLGVNIRSSIDSLIKKTT